MNRVNPLFILLLSVIIAVFSAYSASKKEREFEDLQQEYHAKEDLALKLKALKDAYAPKRIREILRLLHNSRVRQSGIRYEQKAKTLLINGKNVDVKVANMIVSKVLNGTYNLEKFSLGRAKDGVNLEMEIVWR